MFLFRIALVAQLLVMTFFSGSVRALDDLLQYVFVVSRGSEEVVVVDTDRDVVAERIQLSHVPDEVVLSEATRKLLSSNLTANTVTITSLDSLKQEAVIRLDFPPTRLRLGSAGRLLVAGDSNAGVISIIDLKAGEETHRIEGLEDPDYFIFGRDERLLYVASASGSGLAVVDVNSGKVREDIPLVRASSNKDEGVVTALARTPGGQLGFVLHQAEGVMDVVDLRENSQLTRVELSSSVERVYPTANNQYLIVPDNESGEISVFSTWLLRKLGAVPGAPEVASISIALFDSVAFVVSRKRNRVLAFSIAERKRLADIPLPGEAVDSVVSVDGLKIYVALAGSGKLAVVDAIKLKVVKVIDDVGEQPVDVKTVRDLSYCH
jgi:YVTN family beta-propeller protein